MYCYGLMARPRSIGTQPRGYVHAEDFSQRIPVGEIPVWGLLWYDRPLTAREIWEYELCAVEASLGTKEE